MRRLTLPATRRSRIELVLVIAIVAVAAFTRLAWLNLMEFKADEAEAYRLALHVLGYSEPNVGRFFPTAGLISSLHVPNPPLFVWLLALPVAVVRSPLAAASAVALSNVVAVGLCYVVGKRYYSRFVGLAAAALFALAPWGIVFSRKIWAQDTLPLFTTLFLLQLHALVVGRRPRAAMWLILIVAAATQIHFSAWILAFILLAALVLARRALRWEWIALGLAGAIILYLPFLIEHGHSAYRAWHDAAPYAGPGAWGRLTRSFWFTVAIPGGDKLEALIGTQPGITRVASIILSAVAFAGLLLACRDWRTPLGQLRTLLVAWYVLPAVVLTALPALLYIHYFIILMPLPFLGLAYAFERAARSRHAVAVAAVAVCLVYFAVVDARFFGTIVDHGGASGDYGIAYRNTASAAATMARDNFGQSVQVGIVNSNDPYNPSLEYHVLLWNMSPDAPVPVGPPAATYVPVNTLASTAPQYQSLGEAKVAAKRQFGPLLVLKLAG
jgi:hypothetical protein